MESPQPMFGLDTVQNAVSGTADELSSWKFLEDLAVDGSHTASFLPLDDAKAELAKERLKEKNRQAQKRARLRNKVCLGKVWLSDFASNLCVTSSSSRQSRRPWHLSSMKPRLSCMS